MRTSSLPDLVDALTMSSIASESPLLQPSVRVMLSSSNEERKRVPCGGRRHKFALLFSNKHACLEFVDVEGDSEDQVKEFLSAYGDMSFENNEFYDACLAALHVLVSLPTHETGGTDIRFAFLRKAGDDGQGWPCVICNDWEHLTEFVCNYPCAEFNLRQIVAQLRRKLSACERKERCALCLAETNDGSYLDLTLETSTDTTTETLDKHGRTPFQAAIAAGLSPSTLSTIIELANNRTSLFVRDPVTALYPFEAIASMHRSMSKEQEVIRLDLIFKLFRYQDPGRALLLRGFPNNGTNCDVEQGGETAMVVTRFK